MQLFTIFSQRLSGISEEALHRRMLFDFQTQFHRLLLFDDFLQMRNHEHPNGPISWAQTSTRDRHSAHFDGRLFTGSVDEGNLMQLCRVVEASESSLWNNRSTRDITSISSNNMKPSVQSLTFAALENSRSTRDMTSIHESTAQPSLGMYLGNPSGSKSVPHSAGENVEGRLEGKTSPPFHQGQRSRPILPKLLKTGNVETDKGTFSQSRVARPPAEGRGKNQLLPRYWPRITDQELERLSGEYPFYFYFGLIEHL